MYKFNILHYPFDEKEAMVILKSAGFPGALTDSKLIARVHRIDHTKLSRDLN